MSQHRVAVWNFRDAFFLHLRQIEHIQSYSAEIIASSTHSYWGKLLVDTLENERHMESSLLISPLVKHWCFHMQAWETTKQIICSPPLTFLSPYQSLSSFSWKTVAFFCPAEGCQTARSTHTHTPTDTHKYTDDFPWAGVCSWELTNPHLHTLQHWLNSLSETKLDLMTNKRLPQRQMSPDWGLKRVWDKAIGGYRRLCCRDTG